MGFINRMAGRCPASKMGVYSLSQLRSRLLACPMGIRRWACAIQLALIAVLSLLPPWLFPPAVVQIPGMDKWIHGAMYGLLGVLLRWAAGQEKASMASWWLPLAGAGYGLMMEFLQLHLSGGARMFSWGDAAANLIGVVVFWYGAGRFLANQQT